MNFFSRSYISWSGYRKRTIELRKKSQISSVHRWKSSKFCQKISEKSIQFSSNYRVKESEFSLKNPVKGFHFSSSNHGKKSRSNPFPPRNPSLILKFRKFFFYSESSLVNVFAYFNTYLLKSMFSNPKFKKINRFLNWQYIFISSLIH